MHLHPSTAYNHSFSAPLFIQADRVELSPEELASQTVKHVKERHHGTGTEERVDAYEASYERDETSGPLRSGVKKTKTIKEKVSEKIEDLTGRS